MLETWNNTAERRYAEPHEVIPAEFPVMSAAQVRLENWLSVSRAPVELLETAQGAITAQTQSLYAARQQADLWSRIRLFAGMDEIHIFVPTALLEAMVRVQEPEVEMAVLDGSVQGLVVEHVCVAMVMPIEQAVGRPIYVQDVLYPAADPGTANLAFHVVWPSLGEFPVMVMAPETSRRGLMRWIDGIEIEPHDITSYPVTVAFRAGLTKVGMRELAELRPGDAIVLEETWLPRQKVLAVTGERFVQTITVSASGLVLDGPLTKEPDADYQQWTMEHIMSDTSPFAPAPEVAPVSEVQIKLVFELGRMEVTIGELETLGEGYVFDLGKPQTQAVDIIAGGRHIGEGELVRVADGLGVRVTRIFR